MYDGEVDQGSPPIILLLNIESQVKDLGDLLQSMTEVPTDIYKDGDGSVRVEVDVVGVDDLCWLWSSSPLFGPYSVVLFIQPLSPPSV